MRTSRSFHFFLAAAITFSGLSQNAAAALVGADDLARAQASESRPASAADARERINEVLARADVQGELVRQGVDPEEARARVAAMSDSDAERLAAHMESMPAGGIIGAILLVFFVLLITDILGFTKVFPFTRSVR